MKSKFFLKNNFCFSKLVMKISIILCGILEGQSVATDIVRDEKGNILSIKSYNTVSKKLELSKLETFHPNGHVSKIETFSGGLKDGLHKEFFKNGNIKIDGQYINGDKSGLWTEYFRDGGIMRSFYANENGKNGRVIEWHQNGEKKIRGEYLQGQKHGLWTTWFSNGVKESVVTFNQGRKQGIYSYFYNNGNRKSEGMVSTQGKNIQRSWDMYGKNQNCIKSD